MLIHCTKKLLDELKFVPSIAPDDFDSMFSWRANIITINRRKTVVLMWGLCYNFGQFGKIEAS